MDQLKNVLAHAKKHHFWVLVGVVVVVGLAATFMAARERVARAEDARNAAESAFSSLQGVASVAEHPNQQVIDAIQQRRLEQEQEVFEAWQKLYWEQRQSHSWPRVLSQDFRRTISDLAPDEEIPNWAREEYRNFIHRYFPELFEDAGVIRPADVTFEEMLEERVMRAGYSLGRGRTGGPRGFGGMDFDDGSGYGPPDGYDDGYGGDHYGGGPGGSGPGGIHGAARRSALHQQVGKVEWVEADRSRFMDRFLWTSTPNSFQIRTRQEDLWVYESLLRIIRNTNEGATSNFNATVKRIEALAVGPDAAPAFTELVGSMEMFGMDDMDMYGSPDYSMHDGMGGMGDMGDMGPGAGGTRNRSEMLRNQLLNYRYVDDNGKPLAATDQAPYAEFKMMPVFARLVVDQRRLPRLLVECANSPMPVDVKAVRINPEMARIDLQRFAPVGAGVGFGMYGDDMYGDGGPGFGGPGFGGSRFGGRSFTGAGDSFDGGGRPGRTRTSLSSHDITVELLGVVLIYNPPDRDRLGSAAATAATVEELVGPSEDAPYADEMELPEDTFEEEAYDENDTIDPAATAPAENEVPNATLGPNDPQRRQGQPAGQGVAPPTVP